MERTFAIVEREMRRFRRSPMLIVMSLIMPIVQLLVLGYAFGGTVKNLKLGVVDQDRGMPAVRMRELAGAVSSNAKTFVPVQYPDLGQAVTALRNGELNGVLSIPPDFSRRVLSKNDPHVAIIEDNTDGFVVTVGSVIAGVPNAFEPIRLMRLFVVVVVTSMALVSMMFLLMVRMNDPLMPRALFGVLNTFLYFPSGAVYPQQAFPGWMKVIAVIDPFTYAVHALKCLMLKNTGFGAIGYDLLYLSIFTVVCMTAATWLFRRTL